MDAKSLVKVAKALGDRTRFAILQEIASFGEISCGELAARFPFAQATVSHHLRILGESGLVALRREGQHSYFSVVAETVAAYLAGLAPLAPARRRGTRKSGARGAARESGNVDL